jgi:hypothetical protein
MKIRIFTIILISTILIISCQNRETAKLNQRLTKTSIRRSDSLGTIKNNETKIDNLYFPEFWVKFRAAVLKRDTSRIMEMTEFPFYSRGSLDSDPDIEYSTRDFFIVYNIYLKQWSGQLIGNEGTSEFEEIRKMDSVKKTNVTKDYARMGDLVFNKTQNGWKLVSAYLTDDAIDEINKALSVARDSSGFVK